MIQDKLLQASFKGVTFYWRRLSTRLGKKSVSHNYPGSSRRNVEDMGALPKTFTVEASISGGVGSDQYLQNKQALEAALQSPGPGYLVHPTYGRVLVTAKPATCTEENTRLGEARYSLTFEKSEEQARPIGTTANLREIEEKRQQAIDEITQISADVFQPPQSPGAFDAIKSKIDEAAAQIDNAVSSIATVRADAYQVFTSMQSFKNSVGQLITQPSGLFNDLKSIHDQVLTIDDFYVDQFNRLTGFFGNSADSPPRESTTPSKPIKIISYETREAEKNRATFNEASNMMALVNAYSTIAKVDFISTEQLNNFVSRIESQFTVMQDAALMNSPLRDTLLSLRITAHEIIEQKRLLIKDVISVHFKNEIPLSIAMYMYTGSLEDSAYVLGLNADQDVTFAKGNVRLLQ